MEIRSSAPLRTSVFGRGHLLGFVFFNSKTDAAAPNQIVTSWIRQFGTAGPDVGEGISADGLGNVYVAGFVSGNLAAPYSGSDGDAFLRKCNSSGSVIWTRQFGTDSADQATSTSIDRAGNVFVAGWTEGSLAGPNAGAEDAFLTKYDASGNRLWIRQLGTNSNEYCYGVTVDNSGNSFITGFTNGNLGGTKTGSTDAFLAKYDSNGTLLWTQLFGPNSETQGFGASADSSGNVFVAGWTGGGPTSYPFINKYDPAGNLVWTRQPSITGNAIANGVSVDRLGNIFVGGHAQFSSDAFVAKYSESGDSIWVRQFGTPQDDDTNGVSADGLGNVYVAGYTNGNLGGTNAGINDAFVGKFDALGNLTSISQLGTAGSDQADAVSADGLGNAYISGYTEQSLPGNSNAGTTDAFVVKLTEVPEPSTGSMGIFAALLVAAGAGSQRSRSP